jgi:type II secretory pathway pseudopilin PulG
MMYRELLVSAARSTVTLLSSRLDFPNSGTSASPVPSNANRVGRVTHVGGTSPWSIVVPTWLTALATAGLLIGAIVTAIFAIKAFRKQAKEVELLQEQLTDQQTFNRKQSGVLDLQAKELRASLNARNEAATQWRWEYASTVVAWKDEPESSGAGWLVVAHFQNTGERPVRDLSVRWYVAGRPIREREPLTTCFMPHSQKDFECHVDGAAIRSGLEAIIQFRTVGDDWWNAGTDGGLVNEIIQP